MTNPITGEMIEAAARAFYDGMIGRVEDQWPHHDGWDGKMETFKAKVRIHMAQALEAAVVKPPLSQGGAAALPIMNGDHAEFEREWAGKDPKTRPDWPYPSFDARDWAEAFCARFKVTCKDGRPDDGDDMGLMIGWFANALMRGFDEPRPAQAQAPVTEENA